jgi:NADPH:quinone reductase-like Zn-dependent oxidoreductase
MTVGMSKEADNIVGHDFAGIVEEVGAEVRPGTRKVGERVAGSAHGGKSVLSSPTIFYS